MARLVSMTILTAHGSGPSAEAEPFSAPTGVRDLHGLWLLSVVAGTSAGLLAAPPPRPAQPVASISYGSGDEGGEQVLDLVAGQRDESQRWWVAGVFGDRGHHQKA